MKIIALIDPSIASFNLGDKIVSHYAKKIISKMFPDCFFIDVPAYMEHDSRLAEIASKSHLIFFLGTAPITDKITMRWPLIFGQYMKKVILFGVGYNNYNLDKMSPNTVAIYESNLSGNYIHSVRDSFSQRQITKQIPIRTLNTCCPTLWECDFHSIYGDKLKDCVLFTVNSSRGRKDIDKKILSSLDLVYKKIFFYPQTPNDKQYMSELGMEILAETGNDIDVCQIQSEFEFLSKFMMEMSGCCDYVGARLHGGVHAMHNKMRTFIIGVDNRAFEIYLDTGLPVYGYDILEKGHEFLIENILKKYEKKITLPRSAILEWKSQFI